jgi:hypothetical protein
MRGRLRERALGVREPFLDRYLTSAFGQMLVPLGPMPTSCTIVSPSFAAA